MREDLKSAPDEAIIGQVLNGDVNAFEALLVRYKGLVQSIVARRVPPGEMEDVCQEVFIRAYQSLASCHSRDRFRQWISGIALRTCSAHWRRHYRSIHEVGTTLTADHEQWIETLTAEAAKESFERLTDRREAQEVLEWALRQLDPNQRLVLELIYLEGRSQREVSELLGWSLVNVKVKAHRARKKMRKILGHIFHLED